MFQTKIALKLLAVAAGIALLHTNCGKSKTTQEESLPTGKNTFVCKKDGQAWNPTPSGGYTGTNKTSGGFAAYYTDSVPNVLLQAFQQGEYFELYLNNVKSTGKYQLCDYAGQALHAYSPKNYASLVVKNGSQTKVFHTDATHTGYINISYYNYSTKVVAGSFEFDMVYPTTGETIHVSGGAFDFTTHL